MRIATVFGLATFFAASLPLQGQQVRGVVRDSTLNAALSGAVVTIVDASGQTSRRTIADANGRFAVALAPGAARVHVIRIGYRPRDLAIPPHPTSPDVTIDVEMSRIPPVLETMHVSDKEVCPGAPDRSEAFVLWDQARAGLLASVVAREANPAEATTITFDRLLSVPDEFVVHQTTASKTGITTRPFIAAAAPAVFAQRGYMQEDPTGRVFNAPDADVLLDESFALTHCFHLKGADLDHPAQIGVAFTPTPDRDPSLVDVTGVIWMDARVPAVRSLDFLFTQLEPAAIRAGVGGHIQFRAVDNGVAFVEWWSMRMPILKQNLSTPLSQRSRITTRRQDRRDFIVGAIAEAGGEVIRAEWKDGTKWEAEPTELIGAVVDESSRRVPILSAIVSLAGTGDSATTNLHGEYELGPLIPGRYTVSVRDTSFRLYTSERATTKKVDVLRGMRSRLDVSLPSGSDIVTVACRDQPRRDDSGILIGRVLLSNGTLPRNVELRATWQADINRGAAVTPGSPISVSTSDQRIEPDPLGRFVVCGVSVGRPVHIRLTYDGRMADTTIFARDSSVTVVEWRAALHDAPNGVRSPRLPNFLGPIHPDLRSKHER